MDCDVSQGSVPLFTIFIGDIEDYAELFRNESNPKSRKQ